ncbi:hypothetical protein FHG87_007733 [Trinorchestia longiramus]|nr:hypothetical protein FHG87_007733 [Trinorchestia longiramus]
MEMTGQCRTMEMTGQCETMEMTGQCETMEMTGQCGTMEMTGQCGTMEITGQCGTMEITGQCRTMEMTGQCETMEMTGQCGTMEMTGLCGTMEITGQCGTMEMTGHCGTMEMTGHCGTMEMTGQCGTMEMTGQCGTMEMTGHCGTMEMTGHCGTMEMTGQCGTMEMTGQCGTMEMTGQCGTMEMTRQCMTMEMTRQCMTMEMTGQCRTIEMTGQCGTMEMTGQCRTMEMTGAIDKAAVEEAVRDGSRRYGRGGYEGHVCLGLATEPHQPRTVQTKESVQHITEQSFCIVIFRMHQELCTALLLLVTLVSAIGGQQYDPFAGVDGRPPYPNNPNPLHNVRRLIGRRYPTYRQFPRNIPVRHLDVALPMSVLNSDGSLLLHLKDSDLWEKENSGGGENLKAALMPSYLKSLDHSDETRDDITPEEPEDHIPSASDPKMLLSKLFEHFNQDHNLADEGEESLAEIIDEVKTSDKLGLNFNLKDAFKRLFEKHFQHADEEGTNYRHKAMQNPAVFFNLMDLEHDFEKMYESIHGDDGLGEFVQKDSQGGVSFNIADVVKEEQVLENEVADAKELNGVAAGDSEETDLNEKLAEGLRRNNMTVKTGKDGGLFFNLNNMQN